MHEDRLQRYLIHSDQSTLIIFIVLFPAVLSSGKGGFFIISWHDDPTCQTASGMFRYPIFKGLLDDKAPRDQQV